MLAGNVFIGHEGDVIGQDDPYGIASSTKASPFLSAYGSRLSRSRQDYSTRLSNAMRLLSSSLAYFPYNVGCIHPLRESEFLMAKSPQEIKLAMIAGLKEKTGKPLEAWLKIVRASKLAKHKEMVTLLKTKHGLTHGYANMIALQAMGTDSHTATDDQGLVDAQYAGAKAALRPIYDALLVAARKWGDTVEVSPKKAYVSLRREKQFAIVQPSTGTRVDVGLVLPGVEPGERLEAAGSFNAMMTHRVRVSSKSEVDRELIGWLRRAYDLAGPSTGSAPARKGRSTK